MAYQKQTWRDYDDTKTEVVNMGQGAVVTPERMNHIETGVANAAVASEVTAQLAQKAKHGLTCTELEMVANDPTEGFENYDKLLSAINQGVKVLVDDNYHLECASIGQLENDFMLYGINPNAMFTLKENNSFFNATTNCNSRAINEVKFKNEGSVRSFLFRLSEVILLDEVSTTKSSFEGNISFMRYAAPENLDPDVTNFGIGTFIFDDNKVENVRGTFMQLINTPCETYYVRRNKIINFDYTFINFGGGAHTFWSKIRNKTKLMVAEDNYVYCDDNWWGGGDSGSYYCFILYEGLEMKYNNNHVEGIKTDYVMAVYDTYLNVDTLEYSGNTWRNNICFNVDKVNNTLMKSKGGSDIKRYINNNFIVEKEFAERLGRDTELLTVTFASITTPVKRWEVHSNIFDVYNMEFQQSSNQAEEFWLENNTIKCDSAQYSVISYQINSGIDYTNHVHKIHNNTFDIRSSAGTPTFSLVTGTDYSNGENTYGKVSIRDNSIKAFDSGYLAYTVFASTLEFVNNTIEITSDTPTLQGFTISGVVDDYRNIGNVVLKKYGRFSESRSSYRGIVMEDYTIQDSGITSSFSRMAVSANNPIAVKYRYVRKYEILCSLGLLEFSTTFDYSYDDVEGYNLITFTDSTDTTGTYKLSKASDEGNGEGHSKLLKITGNSGPIVLRFTNHSSGNTMYLHNLPGEFKTIKVKTFTTII